MCPPHPASSRSFPSLSFVHAPGRPRLFVRQSFATSVAFVVDQPVDRATFSARLHAVDDRPFDFPPVRPVQNENNVRPRFFRPPTTTTTIPSLLRRTRAAATRPARYNYAGTTIPLSRRQKYPAPSTVPPRLKLMASKEVTRARRKYLRASSRSAESYHSTATYSYDARRTPALPTFRRASPAPTTSRYAPRSHLRSREDFVAPNSELRGSTSTVAGASSGTARSVSPNNKGVSIVTRSGPLANPNDGTFQWGVSFRVPKGANGLLVQRVGVVTRITLPDGTSGERITLFWEAWPVKGGTVTGSSRGDDIYANFTGRPAGTTGYSATTRQVQFYPGATLSDFPELRPGNVGTAGTLPSSATMPANWTSEGALPHNLTVTYGPGGATVVTVPSAPVTYDPNW